MRIDRSRRQAVRNHDHQIASRRCRALQATPVTARDSRRPRSGRLQIVGAIRDLARHHQRARPLPGQRGRDGLGLEGRMDRVTCAGMVQREIEQGLRRSGWRRPRPSPTRAGVSARSSARRCGEGGVTSCRSVMTPACRSFGRNGSVAAASANNRTRSVWPPDASRAKLIRWCATMVPLMRSSISPRASRPSANFQNARL